MHFNLTDIGIALLAGLVIGWYIWAPKPKGVSLFPGSSLWEDTDEDWVKEPIPSRRDLLNLARKDYEE